ncbi:hypothetical protein [Paraburkholderia sp. D1E]|uniref:hypothetical protein n=1 Tax=Paraburkholderia sp. D1E TaxID=3461398 RepID=UPI0040455717
MQRSTWMVRRSTVRVRAASTRCVADTPAPTLVAVTRLVRDEDRNESLRSGFNHHFVKHRVDAGDPGGADRAWPA